MKRLLFPSPYLLPALAFAGALTIVVPARAQACDDGGQKVSICHATGNGRFQTLKVSQCAVQSHLTNHGDFLGACETICTLGASCDDGNACTSDVCNASTGACEHPPVVCDDGNSCTLDSCNPQTGCVHTAVTCDDQNACTSESCNPAAGCEITPIGCDDGNSCTVDTCDPQTGCGHTPVACAPGQSCNPGTGTCQPTATAEVCGDAIDNDLDGDIDEGCIGDRAWNDLNVNGLQDPGEPGLPGATFMLRSASTSALIAIAVSAANGIYHFSNILPGEYYIEVAVPAGFGLTSANAGGDDVDSDFDGESLTTAAFTFTGAADNSWDAGFVSAPPEH